MKSKLKKMFSDFKKGWLLLVILILIAPFSTAMSEEAKFKAMSRNLYLGADIFRVVEAVQNNPDPNDLTPVLLEVADVFQTVQYTNFPARAEAIADEIALAKPQVIGLQEVVTFYKQTPADPTPAEAEDEVINFYAVLDAALQARGMYYEAFTVTNADVELPMIDPSSTTYLSDVRMVDHDVVLVRKGHPAVEVLSGNYATNLGMDLGGVYVEFTRGFVIVDVEIKGEIYRFVSTHLEVSGETDSVFRLVQYYQMLELLGTIDVLSGNPDARPIIMVGDFNSTPEDTPGYGYHPVYGWLPYTPPYMLAVGAGYLDTWLLQSKYDEGYTSGFDEFVSDPEAELFERIDFVFLDPLYLTIDKVKCYLVGNEVDDMTPSGLWPSDHAGIVAKVDF